MCTYQTELLPMRGSAKGPNGEWLRLTDATVYVDHPFHATATHTLNVDLRAPALGPSARVALELTEETALALAAAIHRAIDSAPEGLASKDQ